MARSDDHRAGSRPSNHLERVKAETHVVPSQPVVRRLATPARADSVGQVGAAAPRVVPIDPWAEPEREPYWSTGDIMAVLRTALAVLVVCMFLGFLLGGARDADALARSEVVYRLDASVPDAFLREDRRMLTQLVTIQSESTLAPVAARFGMPIEDLREKIDIQIVELSEVLRIDVQDPDGGRAVAINQAILDEYLTINGDLGGDALAALEQERDGLRDQLESIDGSLNRTVNLEILAVEDRIDDLTETFDAELALDEDDIDTGRLGIISTELSAARQELADLRATRAGVLTAEQLADPERTAVVERLAVVEDRIAETRLVELVGSPIRSLTEPTLLEEPANSPAVQGLALGGLFGLPLAAAAGAWVRSRRRLHG